MFGFFKKGNKKKKKKKEEKDKDDDDDDKNVTKLETKSTNQMDSQSHQDLSPSVPRKRSVRITRFRREREREFRQFCSKPNSKMLTGVSYIYILMSSILIIIILALKDSYSEISREFERVSTVLFKKKNSNMLTGVSFIIIIIIIILTFKDSREKSSFFRNSHSLHIQERLKVIV